MGNNPVNWIDSWGLYGSFVHLRLTELWASQVGIDPMTARIIAEANQSVDESLFQRPENPLNYLIGTSTYHFPQWTVEQDLARDVFLGNAVSFGRFLHPLQDSFSHRGFSWVMHLSVGSEPDEYSSDSPRDREMERLTKWWLTEFKKSLDRRRDRTFDKERKRTCE